MNQVAPVEYQPGLVVLRRADTTKSFKKFLNALVNTVAQDKGVELRLPELSSPRFPALRLLRSDETMGHPLRHIKPTPDLERHLKAEIPSLSLPSTASFGNLNLRINRTGGEAYFILRPVGKEGSSGRFNNERSDVQRALGEICAEYGLVQPLFQTKYPVDLTIAYASTALGDDTLFETRAAIDTALDGQSIPIRFAAAENPETGFSFAEEPTAA